MDDLKTRSLLLLTGLLVVAGIGGIAVGIEPVSSAVGDVAGTEEPKPPALVDFTSTGAQCAEDVTTNSSTSVAGGGANTEVVHSRNVSLPSPSHAIGGPTFERVNESTYALHVPFDSTDEPPRDCPGVARYDASMRIPAGDDPWTLRIYHDGEHVTTVSGDSDHSSAGGSVSVGQQVSE